MALFLACLLLSAAGLLFYPGYLWHLATGWDPLGETAFSYYLFGSIGALAIALAAALRGATTCTSGLIAFGLLSIMRLLTLPQADIVLRWLPEHHFAICLGEALLFGALAWAFYRDRSR